MIVNDRNVEQSPFSRPSSTAEAEDKLSERPTYRLGVAGLGPTVIDLPRPYRPVGVCLWYLVCISG